MHMYVEIDCTYRLVGAFMNTAGFQRRNLADMIMEKIKEKEAYDANYNNDNDSGNDSDMNDNDNNDAIRHKKQHAAVTTTPATLPPKVSLLKVLQLIYMHA
jgi:hypothetical protein